jgi:hypothetical protein
MDEEKLAKELMNVYWNRGGGYMAFRLARFVLRREIEARMEELTHHISGSQEACLHKLERLAYLRRDLERLGRN